MKVPKPSRVTSDHMLGFAGVGLATASAAFGIGMSMHGPAASFGTSTEFTVFAKLAPGHAKYADRKVVAGRAKTEGDLDTTPTASIPKGDRVSSDGMTGILTAITLEAVGTDSATVAIEGRTQIVHVGDEVPGAGQIIAIMPGERPALRTSRGLIVPAAE